MNQDDQILQLLREIKDAQVRHHNEWQDVVRRAEEHQQRALHDVAKAKRSLWLPIGVLIVILLGINYLPDIWRSRHLPSDFPEIAQYSNPIATPAFDGSYVLDAEKSFADLRARLAQAEPGKEETLRRVLAMAEDQFQNFRINHGVITSGKQLIQEFRLTSATTDHGQIQGKAIWHEDIHDPGDCCAINVRLVLEKDVLKFSYFLDGEESGQPIVLRKSTP